MSAKLLEGKVLAQGIKEKLKQTLSTFERKPLLASIQVGENPASQSYAKSQAKTAEALGIDYALHSLKQDTTEQDLIEFIKKLNRDKKTTAIILQLPLPKDIDAKKIVSYIDPLKDAEGMHPENLGRVLLGETTVLPCTPLSVMELIKSTNVKLYGKPLALMLLSEFATTTVCHIATGERGVLPEHVKRAEILVVAVGKAGLIKGEWIKEDSIVIDVGINRLPDGKLTGDVEFAEASKRASFITPVPGGVGPLTTTMLMRNVVELFKLQKTR